MQRQGAGWGIRPRRTPRKGQEGGCRARCAAHAPDLPTASHMVNKANRRPGVGPAVRRRENMGDATAPIVAQSAALIALAERVE